MIEDLIGRAITANTLRILPEIEQDFMELALKKVLEQYPIPNTQYPQTTTKTVIQVKIIMLMIGVNCER